MVYCCTYFYSTSYCFEVEPLLFWLPNKSDPSPRRETTTGNDFFLKKTLQKIDNDGISLFLNSLPELYHIIHHFPVSRKVTE